MFVEDDSGQIWIKGWRQQADLMDNFTLGDIITILGVNARPGLEGKLDLVLTSFSKIHNTLHDGVISESIFLQLINFANVKFDLSI